MKRNFSIKPVFLAAFFGFAGSVSADILPMDGQVTVGTSGGGAFTQTLSSTTGVITTSIAVSNCINGNIISCQVNFFDDDLGTKLGVYDTWDTCSGGTITTTVSNSVACTSTNTVIAPIFCHDVSEGTRLIATGSHAVSITCAS